MRAVALVHEPIDPAALLRSVAGEELGACSLFLGTVRNRNDGRDVEGIEYTAYEAMAVSELQRILEEAADRWPGAHLAVQHRLGVLEIGDVSVAIAAAHDHRAPALDACRYVIEQLKRRVPIWKRERYVDGGREWVDPTRATSEMRA